MSEQKKNEYDDDNKKVCCEREEGSETRISAWWQNEQADWTLDNWTIEVRVSG